MCHLEPTLDGQIHQSLAFSERNQLLHAIPVHVRGQKKPHKKKNQIPGNGGSQELFGPMFP